MPDYQVRCVLEARAELGECPLWSAEEQCLFWIDIAGKSFNRFDPASGGNVRWELPDMPGSFVLREGGGIVLAMRDGFYGFDPALGLSSFQKLADAPYNAEKLRFNDGRTDRQGRYWVGSMLIDIMAHGNDGAYYSYDGSGVERRISPVEHANGTAFSADGRRMFRSETMQRKIFCYDHDPKTGRVSNEQIFATVPDELGLPDGAVIDTDGGYWSALPAGPNGGSVARFRPDGGLDLVIEMPVAICTMPAFGGPDLSTLYVTSGRLEAMIGREPSELSGGIFAVDMPFQGVPETMFRHA